MYGKHLCLVFPSKIKGYFLQVFEGDQQVKVFQRGSESSLGRGRRRDPRHVTKFSSKATGYFCCANQAKMPKIQAWFVSGQFHPTPTEERKKDAPQLLSGAGPQESAGILQHSARHG